MFRASGYRETFTEVWERGQGGGGRVKYISPRGRKLRFRDIRIAARSTRARYSCKSRPQMFQRRRGYCFPETRGIPAGGGGGGNPNIRDL